MLKKKEIKMDKVKSSNIQAIGYDPERKILVIEFIGGSTYRYFGVSKAKYRGFFKEETVEVEKDVFKDIPVSIGFYFHKKIKDKYKFKKIELK